jgi:hypothetical protein
MLKTVPNWGQRHKATSLVCIFKKMQFHKRIISVYFYILLQKRTHTLPACGTCGFVALTSLKGVINA